MDWVNVLLVIVLSYAIGAFPSAYLIGRLNGINIFELGSGNMGATNVLRTLGWRWALTVFVLDVGKGILAVNLSARLADPAMLSATSAGVISAVAVVVGHNWSLFASLLTGTIRGGKGAATAAGTWLILLPLGVLAWALIHASGIHATIAGVLLGFTIPVLHRQSASVPESEPGLAEVFEHRFRPLSAGIAVPVFAFFSAGVAIGGAEGFMDALTDPVTIGILVGLVVGKPIGITLSTWLVTRARGISLDPSLRWVDLVGVGLLAGVGFTVSLLVAELSFSVGDPHFDHAKLAILLASVVAAVLASTILIPRDRRYRRAASLDAQN